MIQFETVFPEFIQSCAKLYQAMVPISLAILVLSFAFEFWRGCVDFRSLMQFLMKLFFIVLLMGEAHQLINSGQVVVEQLVDRTGLVRPEALAQGYKDRLAEAFGDPTLKDSSVWQLVVSGRVLDAIIYAFTIIVSYICLGFVTFVTYVRTFALLVCWACCPVLFALIAIPQVAHMGTAHIMRLLAIMSWPIGFAVAATFTDGLLRMAINDRLMAGSSVGQTLGAAIESLLIIMVVGIWSAVSTLLAPAFIQRFLVGHAGSARVNSTLGSLATSTVLPGIVTATTSFLSFAQSQWQRVQDYRKAPDADTAPLVPSTESLLPPKLNLGSDDPTGSRRLEKLMQDQ